MPPSLRVSYDLDAHPFDQTRCVYCIIQYNTPKNTVCIFWGVSNQLARGGWGGGGERERTKGVADTADAGWLGNRERGRERDLKETDSLGEIASRKVTREGIRGEVQECGGHRSGGLVECFQKSVVAWSNQRRRMQGPSERVVHARKV